MPCKPSCGAEMEAETTNSKEILPAFKTSMTYMCRSTITVTKVLKPDQEGSVVNITRAFLFERTGTRATQRRFTPLHHWEPHAPTQLLFTANVYAGIRNSVCLQDTISPPLSCPQTKNRCLSLWSPASGIASLLSLHTTWPLRHALWTSTQKDSLESQTVVLRF